MDEKQDTIAENNEAEPESNEIPEAEAGESFEDIASEAGFDEENPDLNAAENNGEAGEKKEKEKEPPKPKQPWIDFTAIDFEEDLRNLYSKPFWIIVTLLAILTMVLFVLMFVDYLGNEEYKALQGYVATQHKVPKWYKKKTLPKDVQEILDEYNHKRHMEMEALKLEKEDPRAKEPLMNKFYPEILTNEDVMLILEEEKIGPISRRGAERTELMNLSGLNLTKISYEFMNVFIQSNLRKTNFTAINAPGLEFRGASMQESKFTGAIIPYSGFVRAKLSDADFAGADLHNCKFISAIAERAIFVNANLNKANMDEAVFKLSDFGNAILIEASAKYGYFEGANFRDANLEGMDFKKANLKGVCFVNANLRYVNFSGASLEGANFEGADLEGAVLKDANISLANFKDVKNADREQFESTASNIEVKNIPKYVFPQRKSWRERFKAPVDPY